MQRLVHRIRISDCRKMGRFIDTQHPILLGSKHNGSRQKQDITIGFSQQPRSDVTIIMKNIARLLSPWSLDGATKINSLASILSKAVPVAIGLLCLCSLPAFAADDSNNESNPPSVTNPPSP